MEKNKPAFSVTASTLLCTFVTIKITPQSTYALISLNENGKVAWLQQCCTRVCECIQRPWYGTIANDIRNKKKYTLTHSLTHTEYA